MSRPYKPTITAYRMPNGKFRTPDGKRVTKNTPGAIKVSWKSKIWYGKVKAANGTTQTVPLCADKTASKQILAKMMIEARMAQIGMADVFEEHRRRPLSDHLVDYQRHLEAKNDCPRHIRLTVSRIKAVLDRCRFVFIPDLDVEKVAAYLHELRRDPPRPALPSGQEWFMPRELVTALGGTRPAQLARILRREGLATKDNGRARRYPRETVEALQDLFCRGFGISTSNGYLIAIKSFTRWLTKTRPPRWPQDLLANLSRLNAATDIRRERRALPEEELRRLLDASECNPIVAGELAGPDRAMLYCVAMVTGLRSGELASLDPASFDLDAAPPTVTVRAAYSKNRRKSTQPLPPDVAAALRSYLSSKPAGRVVWPGRWADDAAKMIRIDLAAAGIPYRDEDGRVADFHALRHSYITLLERSGVSPKLAQELARHSDIRLTMNVYTHAGLYDLGSAVASLPTMLPPDRQSSVQPMAATGTDGAPRPRLDQTGDGRCNSVIAIETLRSKERQGANRRKTRENRGVDSDCEQMTTGETEAGELGFEPSFLRSTPHRRDTWLTLENLVLQAFTIQHAPVYIIVALR